jgi:hypothetical protein
MSASKDVGDDYEYDDDDDDNDDENYHVDEGRTFPSSNHKTHNNIMIATATAALQSQQQSSQRQAQERAARMENVIALGLSDPYNSQVADAIVGDGPEEVPQIVEYIRLTMDGKAARGGGRGGRAVVAENDAHDRDDEDRDEGGGRSSKSPAVTTTGSSTTATTTTSNSYAYVLFKPVGWSILGDKKTKKKTGNDEDGRTTMTSTNEVGSSSNGNIDDMNDGLSQQPQRHVGGKARRVKAYDEQLDDFTYVEYNEQDVLAAMTPSERAELMMEGGLDLKDVSADKVRDVLAGTEWDDDNDDDNDAEKSAKKKKKKKKFKMSENEESESMVQSIPQRRSMTMADIDTFSRPSLVNWLKEMKSNEGTPIKGGKYWIAIAGATEIDDSGLVLLCPRDRVDDVQVNSCSYVAVVGNGKKVTSRSRLLKSIRSVSSSISVTGKQEVCDTSIAEVDILSRLKKWRDDDPIVTVSMTFPAGLSTCNHAVLLCQDRFGDGVRGDATADPLDRRSSRRLVHCASLSAASLISSVTRPASESDGEANTSPLPDDIASYANRRDGSIFSSGDFLGRRNGLGKNALTNAYREVNGASDGHPGWIVDRYGKWLFVQHHHVGEEGSNSLATLKGPLPSLHDGNTAGVYYLPTWADRSAMGSERIKPTLLEGQAAPEFIPVEENGIHYLVNLGDSFSTGIFLDQRLQRAYLAGICNENTRVLNCFAHTGAFSVAAATAGAKTVSLDLEKKWLDRIRPQMEANGIMEWDGRHDCLFGDCKFWCLVVSIIA